jgi:hypothetical protein
MTSIMKVDNTNISMTEISDLQDFFFNALSSSITSKKNKAHPSTGHKGTDEEQRYSSTV